MVLAKVPITPQWNLTRGCVCTPDGGFLYVGSRSINYVGRLKQSSSKTDDEKKAPVIKVFHTRQSIISLDVDPGWPRKSAVAKNATDTGTKIAASSSIVGGQQKLFAALAQDNSVQIWDFDRGCAVSGHKAHFRTITYMEGNGPSPQSDHVLLSYMRNRNVLSVNAKDLVVYCVASNTYYRSHMFIPTRNQTLTVLSCSPYNENIFAVGTNRGLVVIGDLKKMSIVYTLRGHETSITALSWGPRHVEPLKRVLDAKCEPTTKIEKNTNTPRSQKTSKKFNFAVGNDDIFDIYDYDYLDNEFGAPTDKEKRAKETAEKYMGIEKAMECQSTTNFDFTEACQSLKEDIDAMKNDQNYDGEDSKRTSAVTLADCQRAPRGDDLSSSFGGDDGGGDCGESTDGSLDLAAHCSSDDDQCVDGGGAKPQQKQILHQAEVHAEDVDKKERQEMQEGTEVCKAEPTADAEAAGAEAAAADTAIGAKKEAHEPQECITIDLTDGDNSEEQWDANEIESKSEMPSVEGWVSQENSLSSSSLTPTHSTTPTLLASASVDGHFWIWNTNTGACCDNVRPQNVNKFGKNTSIHIAWLSSSQFLTNNKAGDLSFWSKLQDNSTAESTKRQHKHKFKEDAQQRFAHRSVMAFSISYRYKLLWCLSSHREICCENLETGKLIMKYCCSSTNVAAMRECPDDMNKIALAFSDRRIGLIDISKMTATNVPIENYISRIDASVLSLVWSPDSKKLAFGTLEGRVGVIHVESNKPTITFKPFCGKPIYSIDWQGQHIFVVCNDILAIYEENLETHDAHIVREVQSVSTVSVRDHLLYVGTQRGHIQVYHRNPKQPYSYILMQDTPLAPRYITEISWSPIASDYVAVVANANNIHILRANGPDGLLTPFRRIEIKNPKAANACVKWSNHNANEFLTCGFDGGIRVWDLNCPMNEEKFLKQFPCPMTCGLFLPNDEQIVMCAGRSTSVELFDMRTEESVVYSAAKWKRSNVHTLEYVKWALNVAAHGDVGKPLTTAEKRRAKRAIVGGSEPSAAAAAAEFLNGGGGGVAGGGKENGNSADNGSAGVGVGVGGAEVADMLGALKLNEEKCAKVEETQQQQQQQQLQKQQVIKKSDNKLLLTNGISHFMKCPTTVLNLTTKELNKDVLEKINLVLSHSKNNNFLCAKLFGKKADAQKLLADELVNNQKSSKNFSISNLFMTQLNSSIREEILTCIQNKQLNEWHVAIAPTISYGFWQKCCQAFAEQLLEQGYALQAATYIIAMHRHIEAIEMLVAKHFYKEALLIGRIHLQSDDPLLMDIIDKWIIHLDMNGNLTGSALLCLLSGQQSRAHDTLAKVRNVHPEIERILEKMKSKQNVKN